MTGSDGKWPWKNHSDAVTPLIPTIRLASASYSTIRSTSRNGQRCGISAWISAVVWIVVSALVVVMGSSGLVGSSVAAAVVRMRAGLCRYARRSRPSPARGRSQERGAPNPIEEVRRHPTLQECFVEQHGLVDRDVRREPVNDELV